MVIIFEFASKNRSAVVNAFSTSSKFSIGLGVFSLVIISYLCYFAFFQFECKNKRFS